MVAEKEKLKKELTDDPEIAELSEQLHDKAASVLEKREAMLRARKEKLDEMEKELRAREKELKAKDARRKQIILRLPESLWRDIAEWAEDDFRSINSQIEYILTKSVKEHKGK